MNRRKVALAIVLCGTTLATQAMACDSARAASEEGCRDNSINEPKAIAEFQGRIRGEAALHQLTLQP